MSRCDICTATRVNLQDPFLFKLRGRWHLLFHQYTLSTAPNNKSQVCHAFGQPAAPPDPSLAVVGGHAVSVGEDLMGEWEYNYWRAAYGMNISWLDLTSASHQESTRAPPDTGGFHESIYRRERPKLLFDEKGEPEWLYNGVCLGHAGVAADPGGRNCFTFAQQIESVSL